MSDTTLDDLRKEYDRFFEIARKVRHHQRQHEEFNSSADRVKARSYQRQLDALIKQKVKEREQEKSNQQTKLF